MSSEPDRLLRAIDSFEHEDDGAYQAYLRASDAAPDVVIEALSRAASSFVQERLCVVLGHHERAAEATVALPLLIDMLGSRRRAVREYAGGAIANLVTRVRPDAIRTPPSDLRGALEQALARTKGLAREEVETALDALGRPSRPWRGVERAFSTEMTNAFSIVFEPEATTTFYRTAWSVVGVRWAHRTALKVSWDRRDDFIDVYRVLLVHDALPLYLDHAESHYLALWILPGDGEPTSSAIGRDRRRIREVLEGNASRLRRSPALCVDDPDALEAALSEATLRG